MAETGTLVTFLLDRSGSMESIKDDTIGAFNAYLDTLKKEGTGIEFSFLQFDSQSVDKVCVNKPIADVHNLTKGTFQPRGATPLIDAAYNTIKAVETVITKRSETPKIVVCIQTDGHENASVEHDWDDLNALIKEKTAAGWQFNFMGTGIDAYDQGARMGISTANTISVDSSDPDAMRASFAASASNTAMYASGRASSMAYSLHQKMSSGDKYEPTLKHGQKTGHVSRKAKTSIVDKISL